MKSTLIGLGISFVFVACASVPKFQKGEAGYSVKELDSKENLEVTLNLPEEMSKISLIDYGYRAVGEECLARGFDYFDVTTDQAAVKPMIYTGFCLTSGTTKSMAITFDKAGLKGEPKKFVVDDLNSKTETKLMIGDEIVSMNGVKPTSMAQVKTLVHSTGKTKNSIQLEIVRNGKAFTIEEPFAQLKDGGLGKTDLEDLRSRVQ